MMTESKRVRLAIIVPLIFACLMAAYHILGYFWGAHFQQIYSKIAQFGLIVALLYIISSYLPTKIKKFYRVGFSAYFIFKCAYTILREYDLYIISKEISIIVWVIVLIFILIYSLYLLSKSNNNNNYYLN